MEKHYVVLLQAVVLAVCIQSGLSVKCYICNSNMNEKCGDPADKMNIKAEDCSPTLFQEAADSVQKGLTSIGKAMNIDIPEGAIGKHAKFACQKIKLVDNQGNNFIMRGCTIASSVSGDICSDSIDKVTGGQGKVEYCGTCEEDYCNGASHQSFTKLLLIMVPCLAAIASRWISI